MRYSHLLIAGALIFSACGGVPPTQDTTTIPTHPPAQGIGYGLYLPELVGQGKPVILFFYKASDPFSTKNDKLLKQLYGTGGSLVSTYKVDFNTSTGARLTYGVVVEDTFILLNEKGERVASFIHPSSADIRILLHGKVPSAKQ